MANFFPALWFKLLQSQGSTVNLAETSSLGEYFALLSIFVSRTTYKNWCNISPVKSGPFTCSLSSGYKIPRGCSATRSARGPRALPYPAAQQPRSTSYFGHSTRWRSPHLRSEQAPQLSAHRHRRPLRWHQDNAVTKPSYNFRNSSLGTRG